MKKPRRKKLPTLARLKRKADHLWATMVLVDGAHASDVEHATCKVCHRKPAVSAHHIFHKGANGRFRYDRRNGLPICTGCHLRERFNPTPVVVAAMNYHGRIFEALTANVSNHSGPHPWTRDRLNAVIVAMETILAEEVLDVVDRPAAEL